jgi:hypothetical protein
LENVRNRFSSKSSWDTLSREDDIILGNFLGYPEQAIQAYCDSWAGSREDDTLFDTMSSEEVLDRLGPTRMILEQLDVDAVSFAEFQLPYVVPASAEISDRVFADIEQFLAVGIRSLVEYDLEVFEYLLDHYKWKMKK